MTESELLQAVLASPDVLPLRLVYADYLLERGDPRGELITVQCQLYTLGAGRSHQHTALRERERALLEAHGQAWLAELGLRPGEGTFVRGMVERLWVKAHRVELAARLAERAPIRSIGLVRAEPGEASDLERALQRLEALPSLNALDLTGAPLLPTAVTALARAPLLCRLSFLGLNSCRLGREGMEILARSAYLGELSSLALGVNALDDEGVVALAGAPLRSLCLLHIDHNSIGIAGSQALAGAAFLRQLTFLSLGDNRLRDQGLRAVVRSADRLAGLVVRRNYLNARSASLLASAPQLAGLATLDISNNQIGDEGALALTRMPGLRSVNVRNNQIGPEGARALRERFGNEVLL